MIIIGEKINSSNKKVASALEKRDTEYIQKLAKNQAEAGADYIDVNAGIFGEQEAELLTWLVRTVQSSVQKPCCIDSPNPDALEKALEVHQGRAMINSITGVKESRQKLIPLVKHHEAKVIALCIGEGGIPETADDRVRIGGSIIDDLENEGIPLQNIYIDPLVQPIATNPSSARIALEVIENIMNRYPGIHTVCGISNISYGLPSRRAINAAFLTMALAKGLDTAILNPCDPLMLSSLLASEALTGRDSYGLKYIAAFRKGKIK
ncbi:MAG: methyltetrahydrofolate cobalamin methyltransferase [Proteobacteria bacterium]|nr:methyltetrahydrofolate cobalamin methyltransferase [Pseudomonadota bacterium]